MYLRPIDMFGSQLTSSWLVHMVTANLAGMPDQNVWVKRLGQNVGAKSLRLVPVRVAVSLTGRYGNGDERGSGRAG